MGTAPVSAWALPGCFPHVALDTAAPDPWHSSLSGLYVGPDSSCIHSDKDGPNATG
jgi:hypothetical protein